MALAPSAHRSASASVWRSQHFAVLETGLCDLQGGFVSTPWPQFSRIPLATPSLFFFLQVGSFALRAPQPPLMRITELAMGFLSSLCCVSSRHIADAGDEKRPRPRNRPPRYNRQNLPSIVVEDPAPWVSKQHNKLELRSDGTIVIAPPSQGA